MAAALIVVPSAWLGPIPFWKLPVPQLLVLAAFGRSYVVSTLALRVESAAARTAADAALVGAAFFSTLFRGRRALRVAVPGHVSDTVSQGVACRMPADRRRWIAVHVSRSAFLLPLAIPAAVALGGLARHAAYYKHWLPRPRPVERARIVSYRHTSLYQLKLTAYANWLPKSLRRGGGLSPWGSDLLLANGDGALFLIHQTDDSLAVRSIPRTVPLNPRDFTDAAAKIYKDAPNQFVAWDRFRVAGVLVQERGDSIRLLAAHHYWKKAQNCFVLRVSSSRALLSRFSMRMWRCPGRRCTRRRRASRSKPAGRAEYSSRDWKTAAGWSRSTRTRCSFQSATMASTESIARNRPSQDAGNSYGKILRLRLATGKAEAGQLRSQESPRSVPRSGRERSGPLSMDRLAETS